MKKSVDLFANYVKYVVERLGSELNYICTINEANMRLQLAAIMKKYMGSMGGGAKDASNADTMKKMAEAPKQDAPKEGDVQVGLNLGQGMNTMMMGMMECAKAFGLQDPRGHPYFCFHVHTTRGYSGHEGASGSQEGHQGIISGHQGRYHFIFA